MNASHPDPTHATKGAGLAPDSVPAGHRLVLNISCYKFVEIHDGAVLKAQLLAQCLAAGLKGTILIAPEGINVFLAGARQDVQQLVQWLRRDARFADLEPKESWSHAVPFRRMRVRLKREIITMHRPLVKPALGRAPAVAPAILRRWLDQGHDDDGRPVVMLDTRNDYEVDAGAFHGALDWRMRKFSEFPERALHYAPELSASRVVTYCTGGIRCEKAAIVMREAGCETAVQLDGGILKYLELEGGRHWRGECFVFDERGGVDAGLLPTRHDS